MQPSGSGTGGANHRDAPGRRAPRGALPKRPKRHHGSVTLGAERVGRDGAQIASEVFAQLSGLVGSALRVTVEIDAEIPNGVPENLSRVVTENGRASQFDSQGSEAV